MRRFESTTEPDHKCPGGVTLSGNNDVGTDRGGVAVGEDQGAVGKCASKWRNVCNKEGAWNMGEDKCFAKDACDKTLTNLSQGVCVVRSIREARMLTHNDKQL